MTPPSFHPYAAGAAHLGCDIGIRCGAAVSRAAVAWPATGPDAAAQWAHAYYELESELTSLRRDNEALLAEVLGRRRAQHGSRSERVSPEQLLEGLRKLVDTEPALVPDGMVEELEQECAERARQREIRQTKRAAKLARRAEAAARQAAAQRNDPEPPTDGGGGGGGGGVAGAPDGPDESSTHADVIELRPSAGKARRNSCLDGMKADVSIQPVPDKHKACPQCGTERDVFDYEDAEMLDIDLPKLRRIRIRHEKRACKQHPETGVVTAPTVARPLPQRLPSVTLLAFVIVCKILDHLPLERLSGMMQRWGTRVAPSTLGDWQHAAADQLQPVADYLGKAILASPQCLHTDGSHIRVIDPSKPGGSTQAGLWGYTVPSLGTYFRVTPDQKFGDTRTQLADRTGATMTDGHPAYTKQRVSGSKDAVPVLAGLHVQCWAHARRPFEQAWRLDQNSRAVPIVRLIQRLYAVEAWLKKEPRTVEDITLVRAARSVPILERLFAHLAVMQGQVTPKSVLGQAIATTLRRRDYLQAYAFDGSLPIDNTIQESQFRSKAVGQHNWLFVGSHAAAQRYATLLTLLRSCVLVGVDPVAYLEDVLMRIQQRGSAADMDSLLPTAFAQRQTVQSIAA
jgi:transposase